MTVSNVVLAISGGALIGLACAAAYVLNGRIAGVSGIVRNSFAKDGGASFRLPFLLGLITTGAVIVALRPSAFASLPLSLPTTIAAGALVGVGTSIGSGCTSGHGVCGLGRGSPRSLVAVCVFMAVAMITTLVVS